MKLFDFKKSEISKSNSLLINGGRDNGSDSGAVCENLDGSTSCIYDWNDGYVEECEDVFSSDEKPTKTP